MLSMLLVRIAVPALVVALVSTSQLFRVDRSLASGEFAQNSHEYGFALGQRDMLRTVRRVAALVALPGVVLFALRWL